jgi:hypothetical protein
MVLSSSPLSSRVAVLVVLVVPVVIAVRGLGFVFRACVPLLH